MPKVKPNGTRQAIDLQKIEGAYLQGPNGQWCHVSGAHSILIVNRQTDSIGKPPRYMLFVFPNGNRQYFSSLYPSNTPGFWRAEYKGQRYFVFPDANGQIIVRNSEAETKSHVYHKDLVSLFGTDRNGGAE